MAAQAQNGRYLYAVVPGPLERTFDLSGLYGGLVYTISNGKTAAVVSDVPDDRVRPERRHLAAQQGVLRVLMTAVPALLPMAFGIIANGTKAVKRILSRNQEAFLQQLERVAWKMEMGLRVSWDVPNIFEYFVNTHGELRTARDRLLGPQGNPSQEDRVELGRLFDRLLQEDRERYLTQVEEALAHSCAEIKRNKCRVEAEVMNLACLVDRRNETAFEADVFVAARLFDNNFSFDYNGPWAPHNFVELDLKL
jgi:hypothetical protein